MLPPGLSWSHLTDTTLHSTLPLCPLSAHFAWKLPSPAALLAIWWVWWFCLSASPGRASVLPGSCLPLTPGTVDTTDTQNVPLLGPPRCLSEGEQDLPTELPVPSSGAS